MGTVGTVGTVGAVGAVGEKAEAAPVGAVSPGWACPHLSLPAAGRVFALRRAGCVSMLMCENATRL